MEENVPRSGWLPALALGLLWSCGGGSSSPAGPVGTPTPVPAVNHDGSWQGRTTEDTNVSFTVQSNSITRFRITFNFGGDSCPVTVDATPQVAIANNSFSFRLNQGAVTTDVTGTFSSANAVSGSYGRVNVASVRCDNRGTVSGFKSGGQFSATRS